MTSSGLGKNTKICCLIGQHGAKLAAEDSAVEAYLLVGAVLKPEVDRRQLTIYVPPCKNPEPNFSAVLWLLGRWAEPSHKPKEARAFKKLFSFPQNTVTGEAGSHARDITGVVWANFFPSSVFLLLETRGSPALPGTGEGRGGCDAAAHPSWVMRLRRGAWMPSVSLSAYARSRFSPCCSLSTSPSLLLVGPCCSPSLLTLRWCEESCLHCGGVRLFFQLLTHKASTYAWHRASLSVCVCVCEWVGLSVLQMRDSCKRRYIIRYLTAGCVKKSMWQTTIMLCDSLVSHGTQTFAWQWLWAALWSCL